MKRALFSRIPAALLVLAAFLGTGGVKAAPGALDTTFAGTGLSRFGFGFGFSQAYACAVQGDGKLVMAGYASSGLPVWALARFATNNVLDVSFGQYGRVLTPVIASNAPNSAQAQANAVQIQADGKIVAAGYSYQTTNYYVFTLARYNTNGALDTSFGTNGTGIVYLDFGQSSLINAMVIQANSNIVVAGYVGVPGNANGFALARFQPNGTLDPSFGTGGTVVTLDTFGAAQALFIEPDSKILAAGPGTGNGDSGTDFALFRYTTNGVLDTAFGGGTGKVFTKIGPSASYDAATAISYQLGNNTIQNPDHLVVAGSHNPSANNYYFALARYNLDGSLDTSFGTGGIVTNAISGSATPYDFAQAVIGQGSGPVFLHPRIITVGGYGYDGANWYYALARYTASGSLDTTFGTGGTGKAILSFGNNPSEALAMTLQSGEFVLAGWEEDSYDLRTSVFIAARFTSSGVIDTNFGAGGVVTADISDNGGAATAVAIQTNGAIVVGGTADTSSNSVCALARFNPDGSLDTTFGSNGKVTTPAVPGPNGLQIQKDAKIVTAGTYNGFALSRFNPNGSLDSTFGTSGIATNGPSGQANAMTLQADGKIVVAGRSSATTPAFEVARFNTNGTLDGSFGGAGYVTTPISFGGSIAEAVAVQQDGKIVAAGYSEGSSIYFALARYNTNGTLDTSFGTLGKVVTDFGSGNAAIGAGLAIQPDGRMVVAGVFDNGNFYFALARYGTNGALDTSFGSGGTVITQAGSDYAEALGVALQAGGKIVAAGYSQIGTNNQYAVVRYNPDGSLDNSFGTGGVVLIGFSDGGSDTEAALALDQIGRPVVVGNAAGLFGVARLQSDPYLVMLSIARPASGHALLQGLGVPLATNTLWGATNVSRSSFVPIGSVLPDASGSWQYDDGTAVGLSRRLYQLSFP